MFNLVLNTLPMQSCIKRVDVIFCLWKFYKESGGGGVDSTEKMWSNMVSVICSYLEIPLLRCLEILVSLRNTIYFRETTVESESLKKWQLHFLKSPSEIVKDNQGKVRGVKLQLNKLDEVRKLSKIVNYSPISR